MIFQCIEVNSKVKRVQKYHKSSVLYFTVPVAQTVEHGVSNANIVVSIPR